MEVRNRAEVGAEFSDVTFEPCGGGLQGKVTLPDADIINESERILFGKEDRSTFLHKSGGGDPVVFEAWCYGEEQVELGYIKFETLISQTYTYSGGGVLQVYPPPREPTLLCVSATEARGEKLPCLSGLSFDR